MDDPGINQWWQACLAAGRLDASAMKNRTLTHWAMEDGAEATRVRKYIQELLQYELAYAEQRAVLPRIPCHTLALLVGYSLEPLLQIISIVQPQRIVLVLNQWYGSADSRERQTGKQRGQDITEWIGDWLAPHLARTPSIDLAVTADSPDAVFSTLCGVLLAEQRSGKSIVVDVTGAKKSMNVGAFLFAAYANIPISYVDFDDYDPKKRRPYGFLCRPGLLANPYQAFALRNWEDVRRAYERYHFRSAIGVLQEIVGEMCEPRFRPEHRQRVKTLHDVLRVYEAWDDGDHRQASYRLNALPESVRTLPFPAAIDTLGPVWPNPTTNDPQSLANAWLRTHDALLDRPDQLLLSNALVLTYAHDELKKIDRLLGSNEDNRSAFLRAMGLDEFLLKARWARLWEQVQGQHVAIWRPGAARPPCMRADLNEFEQSEISKGILRYSDPQIMREALRKGHPAAGVTPWDQTAYFGINIRQVTYALRPTRNAPRLDAYQNAMSLDDWTLKRLRNQAIHMFLTIEKPLAQIGVDLAAANLHEFEAKWLGLGRDPQFSTQSIRTEHVPWRQLVESCGLDFLPLAP